MTTSDAIIAGAVQGFTEFLPISSSGHLVVLEYLYGIPKLNQNMVFTTLLHAGTLLAVVFALWKDIVRILREMVSGEGDGRKLAIALVIATIPGAAAGYMFDDIIDRVFCSEGYVRNGMPIIGPYQFVGAAFIVTAQAFLHNANMALQRREERNERDLGARDMTWLHALYIGCAQALAVVPGISRSGATMATGIITGFSRDFAARFSFLMSIPIVLGAVLHKLIGINVELVYKSPDEKRLLIIGIAAAAIAGFIAVKFMIRLLQTRNFHWFIVYLWIIGLICVAQ